MPSGSMRVLLVEDNLGDARLLFEGLEEALPGQFQMTHVRQLSEALEFLWNEPCDVVLLDLGLPDSHGIDTLTLTRAQAPCVPIVVLTGFQDDAMGDRALEEGAQDYLVKGEVDSHSLARSIRYAVARRQTTEAVIGQGVAVALAEELRRSRQRLIAAQERVRRDVAAQLRGGVLERLLVLRGDLQEFLAGIGPATRTAPPLRDARDGLDEVAALVVELAGLLYPPSLGGGLVPAMRSLLDRCGADVSIGFERDEALSSREGAGRDSIPEPVALAAYRIVEEALNTAVRNDGAAGVHVRLDLAREGWLRLTVRDGGRGLAAASPADGLGPGVMRDYAEAAGGECSIHSDPGAGSVVTALLPLSRTDARPVAAPTKGGQS
jgi:signal transduction histidine kinase